MTPLKLRLLVTHDPSLLILLAHKNMDYLTTIPRLKSWPLREPKESRKRTIAMANL